MLVKTLDERLAAIDARLEAITPGVWGWSHDLLDDDGHLLDYDVSKAPSMPQDLVAVVDGRDYSAVCTIERGLFTKAADAAFIAHAPDDVRWLLGLVKRLSVVNNELSAAFAARKIMHREQLIRLETKMNAIEGRHQALMADRDVAVRDEALFQSKAAIGDAEFAWKTAREHEKKVQELTTQFFDLQRRVDRMRAGLYRCAGWLRRFSKFTTRLADAIEKEMPK